MTDLPSYRFALEQVQPRVSPGGLAREASVAEFPVSTGLSGVSMWLKPGGLRELHWHTNAAEWGYVVAGACRTTIIHPDGRAALDDFGPGDVWYFPRGYGHSIQGIGGEECHFILVFDNGAFSENATFSLSDWLAHTPREVAAACLGVATETLDGLPDGEVYIALGPVPDPRPSPDVPLPVGSRSTTAEHHRYRLLAERPRSFPGGSIRTVSSVEFPISRTMAGAVIELEPGAIREMHWHPNADEWQYYLEGAARMTVFASRGQARTETFAPGDVGYVPMGFGHYIENTGPGPCKVLVAFNSGTYQEIELSEWLATNDDQLVSTALALPTDIVAGFRKTGGFIVRERR